MGSFKFYFEIGKAASETFEWLKIKYEDDTMERMLVFEGNKAERDNSA